jgi:hypothetical protein
MMHSSLPEVYKSMSQMLQISNVLKHASTSATWKFMIWEQDILSEGIIWLSIRMQSKKVMMCLLNAV